jgi:predicted cupin superfamily sugar epimerase
MTADEMIRALGLQPHPEGGHFRETFRDAKANGGRGAATSILFLLKADEVSAWHRVDAVEVWSFHGGHPLRLEIAAPGEPSSAVTLGIDVARGQRPQAAVPAGAWQSARSLGDWTLVGCVVAPAFSFEGFEMAPPGWSPPG